MTMLKPYRASDVDWLGALQEYFETAKVRDAISFVDISLTSQVVADGE